MHVELGRQKCDKKNVTHRPQTNTVNSSSRKPIVLGIFTWTSNLGKTVVNRRKKEVKDILQVLVTTLLQNLIT